MANNFTAGQSVVVNLPAVSQAADPTPEQIYGVLAAIDEAVLTLIQAEGVYAAVPVRTGGSDIELEADPTRLLAELRMMRSMYTEMMLKGAINPVELVSQWDGVFERSTDRDIKKDDLRGGI